MHSIQQLLLLPSLIVSNKRVMSIILPYHKNSIRCQQRWRKSLSKAGMNVVGNVSTVVIMWKG
jgi:hypothetical protein